VSTYYVTVKVEVEADSPQDAAGAAYRELHRIGSSAEIQVWQRVEKQLGEVSQASTRWTYSSSPRLVGRVRPVPAPATVAVVNPSVAQGAKCSHDGCFTQYSGDPILFAAHYWSLKDGKPVCAMHSRNPLAKTAREVAGGIPLHHIGTIA
jgi:hypothetical protein